MKSLLALMLCLGLRSHPPRGAWVEMVYSRCVYCWAVSHPPRGAWVEIGVVGDFAWPDASHPPRGAWVEICGRAARAGRGLRRTPRGVRGLK